MPFRFLNNYATQLAEALAIGQTTLTVTGSGDEFADASPSTPYALTIAERDIRGFDLRRETVHVTGRAGSVLTILRAREGTSEDDWPLGAPVEARETAAGLNEAAQAVGVHEAKPDPHPQYQVKLPGDPTIAPASSLVSPTLDLTDGSAAVTVAVPSGYQLFLDSLDLVITGSDTPSGSPEIQAGPDSGSPAAYLASTPVSVTAAGARQAFTPLVTDAITQVRVAVSVAGTGTAYAGVIVLRGYLLET